MLLKYRPRSEKEMCLRLKKKKFDEGAIRQTLVFLKEKSFLNDADFARAWIASRLKRPLGLNRIKWELKQKGIDRQIIDTLIREIKEHYPEKDIVAGIVQERMERLKDIDPRKVKRRIFSYLLRRGFSSDVVTQAIAGIKA